MNMRTAAAAAALVAALSAPVLAGPLADALARGDDAAIAALRAQPDDAGARCTLGAIYAKRRDLTRAGLFLAGCADRDLALPDDRRPGGEDRRGDAASAEQE